MKDFTFQRLAAVEDAARAVAGRPGAMFLAGGTTLVDLMKIDVEGHELAVLRGAQNLIARSPSLHIVMEWSIDQLRAAGTDAEDVIAFLATAGLTTKHLPTSCHLPDAVAFDPEELKGLTYANIILTR